MFPDVLSCDSSTLVKMLQTKPQTQFLRSGKLRVEGQRNNLPKPLPRFDHTSFLHFLFSCNSCFFLSTTVFPFDVFPHISSFFDFLQCFLQKSIVSLAFNPLIISIVMLILVLLTPMLFTFCRLPVAGRLPVFLRLDRALAAILHASAPMHTRS